MVSLTISTEPKYETPWASEIFCWGISATEFEPSTPGLLNISLLSVMDDFRLYQNKAHLTLRNEYKIFDRPIQLYFRQWIKTKSVSSLTL